MKVGIFSPYLDIYGGGERYVLTAAEFFLRRGDRVDIYGPGGLDNNTVRERFGLDLGLANLISGKKTTFGYDLFFFLSDGSIPFSFARRNILHFQHPFNYSDRKTLANQIKLQRFRWVICNSKFTKGFIDKTYGVDSRVVYPPVDVDKFSPGRKENIILSVGRFQSPSHPKKQEVLLKAFTGLVKDGLEGWRLILFGGGGVSPELKKMAENFPVKFCPDGKFVDLQKNYAKAKIYWHATGFGEDLINHPDKAEHFGITTVEAMAAGCVPVVFSGGGQKEIVEDGESGFFWETPEGLKSITTKLIDDRKILEEVSLKAQKRAKLFSKEKFFQELEKICAF